MSMEGLIILEGFHTQIIPMTMIKKVGSRITIYSFNSEKYAFDYNYTKPIYAKSSPRYGKIHIKGTPPIKIRDQ